PGRSPDATTMAQSLLRKTGEVMRGPSRDDSVSSFRRSPSRVSSMAGPNPEQLLRLAKTDRGALGQLLERYRSYLALLARLQINQRLRGKLDEEDLVQQTFLLAQQHFVQFRGTTEHELVTWLRRILAHSVANAVRHYLGTKHRDLRLERQL